MKSSALAISAATDDAEGESDGWKNGSTGSAMGSTDDGEKDDTGSCPLPCR